MIWTIGAWMLLVLGLGLFGYGLFWDRPGFRGRPERWCRKCGYDLSGAGDVPVKCTECGRVHEREGSLRRVRRHKRVVVAGVVLVLAAGVLALLPSANRGTLFKPLPGWVLVELQPLFPQEMWVWKNHPSQELTERLMDTAEPMSHEEIAGLIERVASGGVFASAGSRRWAQTSGQWIGGQVFRFGSKQAGWHYPDGTLADEPLNKALDKLMRVLPEWEPATRAKWPEGMAVTIESGSFSARWPVYGRLNEKAVVHIDGHDAVTVDGFIQHFEIDPIGKSGDVIEGQIELSYFRERERDRVESTEPEHSARFPIRWEVVGGIRDAVELVQDNAMLDGVRMDFVRAAHLRDYSEVVMDGSLFESRAFENLGFGVRVTLFDGQEKLAEDHLRWMCRDGDVGSVSSSGLNYVPFDQVESRIDRALLAGTLRVRVEGDPEIGLEIIDADRVWVGMFEVASDDVKRAVESVELEAPPESAGP